MIPLIVDLLNMNQLRLLVLIELYLLSTDDNLRTALAATDCPHLVRNSDLFLIDLDLQINHTFP